jgi:hypothetical protein
MPYCGIKTSIGEKLGMTLTMKALKSTTIWEEFYFG